MMKKNDRIEIARRIISSVKREMQKPRLTESVRVALEEPSAPTGRRRRHALADRSQAERTIE
jgi:hypothetical protein